MSNAHPKICFFGATADTGNLGVSALFDSVVVGLLERIPGAEITAFDNGWGKREGSVEVGDQTRSITCIGARNSRRYHRRDSLANIRFCCHLGGLGNPGSKAILGADAILDISGGDSFTDLYGEKRFRAIVVPKLIALEQQRRLIFLPQTYGPFTDGKIRAVAQRVLKGATQAWARDVRSYDEMKKLLGDDFDDQRHCSGVDVAFLLRPRAPKQELPQPIAGWLESGEPVTGFNVSGLVYSAAEKGLNPYGLRADYLKVVDQILTTILEESDQPLLLVPHVVGPHFVDERNLPDCDMAASQRVAARLNERFPGRVSVLPEQTSASEIKGVIQKLEWFCGTRMHSTIASLSTGVPTATVSYSYKAQGVFESCGQGEHVADPRSLDTDDVIRQVLDSWRRRDEVRDSLAEGLPPVLNQATQQLDRIADACQS